ncbi:MAG TPA: rhodanese-like domain-containing protein [Paucimonas sp.]|nr:rhodanese-like domain-containing protein [Paucimonas sp.]
MGILEKFVSMVAGSPAEELPEEATLIDVRSPAEYAAGHVEGAVLLPLQAIAQGIGKVAQDKAAPIVVYCQSGARSASARQQLLGMGYGNVINGGGVHAVASRLKRDIVR